MFTIEFTFKDGIVGHLDFNTLDQVRHWLPQFQNPEVMKKHGVVGIVVVENRRNEALSEAA
jgi:hypothetical protein